MRYLTILLLLALSPFVTAQDEDESKLPPPPSKEQVEAAVDALEAAYRSKEPAKVVAAIDGARAVLHADVIELVADGLKDKSLEVQDASIDALRWMEHPDALSALLKHWKKNKALRKDVERAPSVLKAIGQHADASSLDVLTDNVFENPTHKVVQARLLALGRIRDVEAIDTLMDLMAKRGGGRGGRGGNGGAFMNDFRMALTVLTGRDLGRDANAWRKWWSDNEKGFEVPPELPELPRDVEILWKGYWGLEDDTRRGNRREDRGRGADGQ
ncbi:MAG: hypothetical protein WD226_05575 [Planctomycetota bacterium]